MRTRRAPRPHAASGREDRLALGSTGGSLRGVGQRPVQHAADQLAGRPPCADDVALALEQIAPPRVEEGGNAHRIDRTPHQRLAILETELPGSQGEQAAGTIVLIAPLPALELE